MIEKNIQENKKKTKTQKSDRSGKLKGKKRETEKT
jgi:hypothetical protein